MNGSAEHRAPDGSFRNPWPDSEPHPWSDLVKWWRERRAQPRAETPPRGSFPTATPVISYPRSSETEFAATWIGHSTVLLQLGAINLITDPVFSQRAFPLQWIGPRRIMDPALPIDALPPLDVILLSHNHYDHLDKPAVKRIARAHPLATWVVPLGLGAYVRGWGAREIVSRRRPHVTSVRADCATATNHSGAVTHSRHEECAPISPVTRRIIRSSVRLGNDAGHSIS
jgi:hypothetical protein